MNGELMPALPTQSTPVALGLLDSSIKNGPAISSRAMEQAGRPAKRTKSTPLLATSNQGSYEYQTPEALLSNFRQSILASRSQDQAPLTIITSLLSLHYPVSTAIELASTLISTFGSLAGVLRRSAEDISRTCALNVESVVLLKTVHSAVAAALREPIEKRPIITTHAALEAYLKFTMTSESLETVRTIFLNQRNFLLKDELHATGDINGVQVSIRNVIQRVLEVGATGLIIVHNHPSGDPMPSDQDLVFTQQLKRALETIEVVLHDHVIVGKHRSYSFKAAQLL